MDRFTDPRARFAALYDGNVEAIVGYALRRVDQPTDAADVVAETFLVAWRRLDDVPVDGTRLWLYGVARRVLANQRRGAVRRSQLADRLRADLATHPPLAPAPSQGTHEVLAALRRLAEADREIVQLTAWEGLTPSEAAGVLGIPAATARTRLHRARAHLRIELDRGGVERSGPGGHWTADGPPLVPGTKEER